MNLFEYNPCDLAGSYIASKTTGELRSSSENLKTLEPEETATCPAVIREGVYQEMQRSLRKRNLQSDVIVIDDSGALQNPLNHSFEMNLLLQILKK